MPIWIVTLVLASPALAQPYVDATIDAQIEHGLPSVDLAGRLPMRPGSSSVVIELGENATTADLTRLEALGVAIRRIENRPVTYGRLVSARVDRAALARLRTASFVRSVLRAPPATRPPLDRSRELLRLPGHGIENSARERLTGSGVVIADVDTVPDVFHPDFFYADAGWYSWIDADGDGAFTPGSDAVDLDADGVAGANEIGRVLRSVPIDVSTGAEAPVRPRGFDPALDWIYADENASGERETAPGGGFTDATAAFGEALFVPDDIDGDGVLDPEERLVRLGTSKLRKVLVDLAGLGGMTHVFERGVDLTEIEHDYTGGIYGFADGLHGTGVLAIAAGGVPLLGRRFVGIAPDAELVLAWSVTDDVTTGAMWALEQSPDVMIHEAAVWTRFPLDGSDAWSEVVHEGAMAGVAHACPVGNIGGARKHAVVSVGPGETASFPISVPASTRLFEVTIQIVGDDAIEATIREPSGTVHPIDPVGPFTFLDDGSILSAETSRTPRGTAVFSTAVLGSKDFTRVVPSGEYLLEVPGDTAAHEVHAFVSDSESSFGLGAAFDPAIATDRTTLGVPAVADDCLRIGAIPSHLRSEGAFYRGGEGAGVVRLFSARGPRIDGELGVHVVAPDNPWVPAPAGDLFPALAPGRIVLEPGSYMVFGGTSGAGPHVAGVLALLAQDGVHGLDAYPAVREGADASGLETPNDDYGDGRLDAAGAIGATITGEGPTISLAAQEETPAGASVHLVATVSDPDGGALEVRWDDGYDGTWDTAFASGLTHDAVQTEAGLRVKARVRDPEGHLAEAAIFVPVSPAVDAGVPDGGIDAGAARDAGASGDDDDGCGCRAASPPTSFAFVLVALALALRSRLGRPALTRGYGTTTR